MDKDEALAPVLDQQTLPNKIKISGGIVVKSPGPQPYSSYEISAFVSKEFSAETDVETAKSEVTALVVDAYKKNVVAYHAIQSK